MPKTKISEYSATANSNTDVASINIDEGCAPSGINNAIRAVMGHLKDFQQGTNGDPFNGPVNGTVGATTPSTGAFTTLSASSTVTLSGGTANGVAYLNGSKVLTTGSALTFNGSTLAVTGTISSNNGSANNLLSINGDGAIQSGVQFKANGAGPYTTIYFDNSTNHTYYKNLASGGHLFYNNTTQAMTLDASGNLMVGVTSALGKFTVLQGSSSNGDTVVLKASTASAAGSQPGVKFLSNADANLAQVFADVNSGALITNVNGSESARIDSSGNLLVKWTTYNGASNTAGAGINPVGQIAVERDGGIAGVFNRFTSDGQLVLFRRSGTTVGAIEVTTTATSYVTSSDYRLKNSITPMTGALAKVAALKPVTYKWNADGSDGEGFIAHELAEVCPHAVTGEKDGVDENGNPKYQGIDTSFLVATLTAAIQELKAEFDAYKASHP